MRKSHPIRPFSTFLWLCLASASLSLTAAEPELPLPDTVIIKSDAALPKGATGREIQGALVSETAGELKLETSKFRGISNLITLPLTSVESVKRGDHSERDYLLIKPLLELPETSTSAAYYQNQALPPLEAFLAKYPESSRKAEVTSFRNALALDLASVLDGDFRFGNFWLRRKEMSPEYRTDIVIWQELEKNMTLSPPAEFKLLTGKLPQTKTRPYYPYLVEKALATSVRRIQSAMEGFPDPAQASGNKNIQEEVKIQNELQSVDSKSLKRAVLLLGKMQQLVERPEVDAAELKTLIAECRFIWPDLDGIDHVLLQGFNRQIAAAGNPQPGQALKNAAEIFPLITRGPSTLKAQLDEAGLRQNIQQLMKEARTFLEQGKEPEAIARINRIQGMIKDDGPLQQSLQDLTLQATSLFTSKGLEESRKHRTAGQLDDALDDLRKTETQLLSYKALDTARADVLALESVEIASQAAKSLHLIIAVKASYAGWSISPTNIKARISCIIVVVSLLTTALILFIVLILLFSWLSNILHKDRFDSRLKSLREDEKTRRQSSARRRQPRDGK